MAMLLITVLFYFLPYKVYHRFVVKDWLYLLGVFMALPFIFTLSKQWTFDRYIGELSYPVYIVHMLVLKCIMFDIPALNTIPTRGAATLVISIVLSIALNELVQKRIEKVRQRRVEKKQTSLHTKN